jgi:hypothetical protein
VEFRQFNYVGDVQWLGGTVVRKHVVEGTDGRRHAAVDLDLWARNQRDVITTPGTATVLLPSREFGPVQMPEPVGEAADLSDALTASVERFEAR